MKIRTDFVTNSSSSSFIISTNEEVPQKYKNIVKEINKSNLHESMKEKYEWDTVSYEDELLQKEANLSEEQMLLIKMAINNELDDYIELKNKINNTNEFIYSIFVDRDWLYYQKELQDFIDGSEILQHETDL